MSGEGHKVIALIEYKAMVKKYIKSVSTNMVIFPVRGTV